jgi:hypothetical protein
VIVCDSEIRKFSHFSFVTLVQSPLPPGQSTKLLLSREAPQAPHRRHGHGATTAPGTGTAALKPLAENPQVAEFPDDSGGLL